MQFTFRWYGTNDPITLKQIRQIPAVEGIVSAIYDVPVGDVWPLSKIRTLSEEIHKHGLNFSVIESVPVHEKIKLGHPDREKLIINYIQTLKNLSQVGIAVVTYNFMPVFDWMRTNLHHQLPDGSQSLGYDEQVLQQIDLSTQNFHLPGWDTSYEREKLQTLVKQFQNLSENDLRQNLVYFLKQITPVAEELDIKLAIHPDDPPWSIFGLPRVMKNQTDMEFLLNKIPSPMNGFALCSGSFGAAPSNHIPTLIRKFGKRVHFGHIRNIKITGSQQFHETAHTTNSGSLNIREIMQAYADINYQGPIRPDHGRMIWDEQGKPGYGLYDRALGIMYLKGLWEGIMSSQKPITR